MFLQLCRCTESGQYEEEGSVRRRGCVCTESGQCEEEGSVRRRGWQHLQSSTCYLAAAATVVQCEDSPFDLSRVTLLLGSFQLLLPRLLGRIQPHLSNLSLSPLSPCSPLSSIPPFSLFLPLSLPPPPHLQQPLELVATISEGPDGVHVE